VWGALGIKEELSISNLDNLMEAEDRLLEELSNSFLVDEDLVIAVFRDLDNRLINWPIPFKGFGIDWSIWADEGYDEFLPLLYFFNVVPMWAKADFDQRIAEFWLDWHDNPWCPWVPDFDYPEDAEEMLGKLPPPWDGLKVVYQILIGNNENPFLDACGITGEGFTMEFEWSPRNLEYLKEKYNEIRPDLETFIAYRNVWYAMVRHEGEKEALRKIVKIILEA
jgi:hypothetical protein